MKYAKKTLIAVTLISGHFQQVNGELVWKNKEVSLNVKRAESKTVVATYEFTNSNKEELKIMNVETSCGCTVASMSKKVYAPGEIGKIDVAFQIGDRRGPQHKLITVTTNDKTLPLTVLSLNVEIPEPVRLIPIFLTWENNDEVSRKPIIIQAAEGVTLKSVAVKSSNPDWKAEVERTDKIFRIIVFRNRGGTSSSSTLKVTVETTGGSRQQLVAVARAF